MNYLLDTHIWIRTQLQPQLLSRRVQAVVSDPRNALWISPISVVEFGALHRNQRVRLNEGPATWLPKALAGLHEAVITTQVALAADQYAGPLADPADRILAATAAIYELCLITADEKLAATGGIEVLDNRD